MPDVRHEPPRVTRVAILTSVHPWNDPRIYLKEARALAASGYDVTLVAERDSDDELGGIHIRSIPFARSRLKRMLFSPLRIASQARRADICHFHDPELIPLGMLLKALGKRVVYDVHEDLPRAIEYKFWIPARLRWLFARCAEVAEGLIGRVFDIVVAATPIIGARFPAAKTVIVQNFPILGEMASANPTKHASRPPQFIYVGTVAAVRGAVQMVDAMGLPQTPPEARVTIVGNYSPDSLLQDMQKSAGWRRTDYLGYQGRAKIGDLLGKSRAGLVVLQPVQNLFDAFPTKLFEYMSAGLPVIASDYPIIREIIAPNNLGILVNPQDPAMIADAMRWILEHPEEAEAMGERGRIAVLEKYSWDVEARKLIAAYATLK